MNINLIAIGRKTPKWVAAGFQEYATRLPKQFSVTLIALASPGHGKQGVSVLEKEGQRLLAAVPKNNKLIALDQTGIAIDSLMLSQKFKMYYETSQDVSFLIGGPEGLSRTCLVTAEEKWSLSALTFPHQLVRIIVVEQLYRAWSLLSQHPYHR